MGYCVHLSGQKFRLPAANVEACLNSLLATKNKWLTDAVKDVEKHVKHFVHLPANIKFIELVMDIWSFKFTLNKDNDIDKVSYEMEKMRDFDGFCKVMAPFVESGSYLEFTGEDSSCWRYVFRDGSWKNVKPIVTWPD